jgi:Mn2+/Fe2+ NRAMP family transporter
MGILTGASIMSMIANRQLSTYITGTIVILAFTVEIAIDIKNN